MRKPAAIFTCAAMLMAGGTYAMAQTGSDDVVCDNPALSSAEQTSCQREMKMAKTDAQKAQVRATYEAKANDSGSGTTRPRGGMDSGMGPSGGLSGSPRDSGTSLPPPN